MEDITKAPSWPRAKAARDALRELLATHADAAAVAKAKAAYKALAVRCHHEVGNL